MGSITEAARILCKCLTLTKKHKLLRFQTENDLKKLQINRHFNLHISKDFLLLHDPLTPYESALYVPGLFWRLEWFSHGFATIPRKETCVPVVVKSTTDDSGNGDNSWLLCREQFLAYRVALTPEFESLNSSPEHFILHIWKRVCIWCSVCAQRVLSPCSKSNNQLWSYL